MKKMNSIRSLGILWLLLLTATVGTAAGDQPQPLANTFVHDFAGVIADEKKAEIQAKAQQLKDLYQTEIAVVTITSLEGEDSFDYSLRLARSWGIGSKENDIRGLLILVAVQDKKTSFRTSRHIEGELPDGVTGEISRQMNPYFKSGDFGGGLSLGLSKIMERLSGVYEAPEKRETKPAGGLLWLWLLLGGSALGGGTIWLVLRMTRRANENAQQRAARLAETRQNFSRQTGKQTREMKQQRLERKQKKKQEQREAQQRYRESASAYQSSASDCNSSSSSSSSSSDSSSSYDYGSSSSSDSGSSYSGGSDFGGGGSDSSW